MLNGRVFEHAVRFDLATHPGESDTTGVVILLVELVYKGRLHNLGLVHCGGGGGRRRRHIGRIAGGGRGWLIRG
jgi:hypothetical protein